MCLREKIGPDPRNFNQRVSLGRNDLLIRTFPKSPYYNAVLSSSFNLLYQVVIHVHINHFAVQIHART
jgi:hypothetical protein